MKKWILSLAAFIMVITACWTPIPVSAQTSTSGYYTYKVSDGEAIITDVDTSISGDITIPHELGGCPVVSIGFQAFAFCKDVTSVIIPDSVTFIAASAFCECSNLTGISIPDSVIYIDRAPFSGCSNLVYTTYDNGKYLGNAENPYLALVKASATDISSCMIHPQTKLILDEAFRDCADLTGIQIGENVANIGLAAFMGCKGLKEITIPDSVTNIDMWAFHDCTNLQKITIGSSVSSIGSSAFEGCSGLTDVYVTSIYSWWEIRFENDYADPMRYFADRLHILDENGQEVTEFVIDDTVTAIPASAFQQCIELTSITIPDSVTSIGAWAFAGCKSLKSITIPFVGSRKATDSDSSWEPFGYLFSTDTYFGGVATEQHYSRDGLLNSKIYYIPESLKSVTVTGGSIVPYAFENCYMLTDITLKEETTGIGDYAFLACTRLTNITISDKITKVGNFAFSGCSSLKSVFIPGNVMRIGGNAFLDCAELASVTLSNGIQEIGYSAFSGCSSLQSIVIPDSVTFVGEEAFSKCTSLRAITIPFVGIAPKTASDTCQYPFGLIFGTICYEGGVATDQSFYADSTTTDECVTYYIPASLKTVTVTGGEILHGAFQNCSGLTEIILPNRITEIASNALSGCAKLEALTIPNGVISIGDHAMKGCASLTEITIPESVTGIGLGAFSDCTNLSTVNYNAPNCARIGSEEDPVFQNCSALKTVNIGAQVKKIPTYAFYGCTGLENLTIPNHVTEIGGFAFKGCASLTEITIPASVTSIGGCAFADCTKLAAVNYNAPNCSQIGSDYNPVFQNCTGLKTVNIGAQVKIVPKYAFYGCSYLTSVTIPESVDTIGENAFYNCIFLKEVHISDLSQWCKIDFCTYGTNPVNYARKLYLNGELLTKLVIPDDVDEIGAWTFSSCYDLTEVFIPDHVTSIEDYAFHAFPSLYSIVIGSNVTSIGNCAFYDSTNIDVVFYRGTVQQGRQITFGSFNDDLTSATWHYEVEETVFAQQNSYYCAKCDNYFLQNGDYALATVTFLDWDGTKLSEKTLKYKDKVTPPADPKRQHEQPNQYTYTFAGWDKEVVSCAGNAVYTATYQESYISYEVTFQNWNGEIIASGIYHWGDVIPVPEAPQRNADKIYTYTFAGWEPAVVPCAGTAVYKAAFIPEYINYTVRFQYEDGTVIEEKTYHYGEQIVCPPDPEAPESLGNRYAFSGWDQEINRKNPCRGDTVYTAIFQLKYTPGDVTGDGKINSLDGLMLMRHLNGWTLDIPSEDAMDVNADGKVNSLDGLLLMRYLNGWDVTLG